MAYTPWCHKSIRPLAQRTKNGPIRTYMTAIFWDDPLGRHLTWPGHFTANLRRSIRKLLTWSDHGTTYLMWTCTKLSYLARAIDNDDALREGAECTGEDNGCWYANTAETSGSLQVTQVEGAILGDDIQYPIGRACLQQSTEVQG